MKTNKLLIVFLIILLSLLGCSKDAPEIEEAEETFVESTDSFNKSITTIDSINNIQSAIQLKDSSYILVGGIQIDMETRNLIIKLDKYGNKEWLKVMQNTRTPNGFERIFVDNNQLVAYRSSRYGYEPGEAPALVYFNNKGDILDEFQIENSILGFDVLQEDDGYVAAGRISDFEVQKINKQGIVIWTEKLANADGLSISKLQDGNYITIGGGTSSGQDEFLIKIDNSGKKIWSKPIQGYKVLALPDNGFIALPQIDYTDKIELIRFDEDGNQLWKHELDNEWGIDINSMLRHSWLFNYGTDHYVYCLHNNVPYPELIFNVINSKGYLINTLNIKLNYDADMKGVSVTKTLDGGFLIVSSSIISSNLKLYGAIDIVKIPRSEVLGD